MADEEQEIRTQKVQQGNTEVEKQTISHHSADDSVVREEKIVYLIYGVLAGLLLIRFILSLLGANRLNAFADMIYSVTSPLVAPFRGLFDIDATYGVSRFDVESLVAIIVYGLVAWVIAKALDLGRKTDATI
ncbi:YggT family protein [Candidatus Saccharibacteria bacterium]|nr:YggT family protein [Candidatus Saccharibacteria bacterium]